jgi:hypothetical protein
LTRTELQDLTLLRLEEAEALFDAQKFDGCVYLCGYVVELGLKAVVCRTLDLSEYPESKQAFRVHDFDNLVLLAGMQRSVLGLTGDLRVNWSVVSGWNSTMRYASRNTSDRSAAQELLEALRDSKNGVLAWLQARW